MGFIEEGLWVEKYRPDKIEEIIGNFGGINRYIKNPKILPHFLFLGSPGTGKTTLAKAIIKALGADSLRLNASDESGVETIRQKVKKFITTMSSKQGIPKIVFLDEADHLSVSAQAILRAMMEEYHTNCRFILTGNYKRKIIDPLKSRCVEVEFGKYKKEEVVDFLRKICEKEKKPYNPDALIRLVDKYFPDIRSALKQIQLLDKITDEEVKTLENSAQKIIDLIRQKQISKAREMWNKEGMDARELLKEMFEIIIKNDMVPEKKKLLIDLCGIYDYRMAVGADPEIQLTDFALKMAKEG